MWEVGSYSYVEMWRGEAEAHVDSYSGGRVRRTEVVV